ncbi:MAG: anti-sigma factor [Acidimicrobiales bacterium]
MQCEDISGLLAGVVDGSAVLDPRSSAHVGGCLRCQAEVAQYRRLLRTLRQLRDDPVAVPADLPALVLARLDHPNSPWARRAAYAGALAATAAGAAGAIVLVASRSRRLRLAG